MAKYSLYQLPELWPSPLCDSFVLPAPLFAITQRDSGSLRYPLQIGCEVALTFHRLLSASGFKPPLGHVSCGSAN